MYYLFLPTHETYVNYKELLVEEYFTIHLDDILFIPLVLVNYYLMFIIAREGKILNLLTYVCW